MQLSASVLMSDFNILLSDDGSSVGVLVQEESGDAAFDFTVHNGPLDRGRSAILRK